MNTTSIALPGRCYWVCQDYLLAGGYPYNPGIDDPQGILRALISVGIDAFVDLTEEDELTHYEKIISQITDKPFIYKRFAIIDYSIPTVNEMHAIVKHINQMLANGRRVYLHCRGGIGRTGTAVGCWLCSQGMNGREALVKLGELFCASNASRFTSSPESEEQRNFVINYVPPRE